MKRFNRDRCGEAIGEVLEAILGMGLVLLWFWGVGWSFYRHGAIHGGMAFVAPPYAWYRGVAAIWDKPEWKEDYDVRTEQLALVIENAVSNDPAYQIESRDYIKRLKEWIKTLPPRERDRGREASRNYALAMGAYIQRFFSEVMEGNDNPQPDLDATVQQRVEKFKSVAGFANRWQRFVQDSAPALKDLAQDGNDNGLRNTLRVGDRAIVENRMHTYLDTMAAKMESVIDELFSTK